MDDDVYYEFIDSPAGVRTLCNLIESLGENDLIGLDTEFMRVTCYYPDFSLLQLAIHDCNYLVDVWMLEGQVQPLIEALCHTRAIVLAFACSEDIELLAHEARRINCDQILPERIYDLQLMLAFCGHSYGRGLNFALQEFLGITLAKDCTRSNWTHRPLTTEQLNYSALDVEYLEPLFHKIREIISERNFGYFIEEMNYIRSRYISDVDEDNAYLAIPAAGLLNEKELNVLHYLARERMELARSENQALNRIITSKSMWQLARYMPRSKKELEHRGVKHGTIRQFGDIIVKWIAQARQAPMYPDLTIPYDYFSHQRSMQENFEALKRAISKKLENSNICPQVLLKKQLLNDYFRAKALGQTPLLQTSWRLDLLGPLDVPLEPMSHNADSDALSELPSPDFVSNYLKLNQMSDSTYNADAAEAADQGDSSDIKSRTQSSTP